MQERRLLINREMIIAATSQFEFIIIRSLLVNFYFFIVYSCHCVCISATLRCLV